MEPAKMEQQQSTTFVLKPITRENIEMQDGFVTHGKGTLTLPSFGVKANVGPNAAALSASCHKKPPTGYEKPYQRTITDMYMIKVEAGGDVTVTMPHSMALRDKETTYRVDQKGIAVVCQNARGEYEIQKVDALRVAQKFVTFRLSVPAGIPTRFCVAVIDSAVPSLIDSANYGFKFHCDNPECRKGGKLLYFRPSGISAGKDWPLNACPTTKGCRTKVMGLIEEAYKIAQEPTPVLDETLEEQPEIYYRDHRDTLRKQGIDATAALGNIKKLQELADRRPQDRGVAATIAMWVADTPKVKVHSGIVKKRDLARDGTYTGPDIKLVSGGGASIPLVIKAGTKFTPCTRRMMAAKDNSSLEAQMEGDDIRHWGLQRVHYATSEDHRKRLKITHSPPRCTCDDADYHLEKDAHPCAIM